MGYTGVSMGIREHTGALRSTQSCLQVCGGDLSGHMRTRNITMVHHGGTSW